MKYIFTFLMIIFLSGCGSNWQFENEVYVDFEAKTIVIQSEPVINISYGGSLSDALTATRFLEKSLNIFNDLSSAGVDQITLDFGEDEIDFYYLFFRIGKVYFSDYENPALAWGIVNLKWQEMVKNALEGEDFLSQLLKPYQYSMIRIDEFEELFKEYMLTIEDMSQLAKYINTYLLEDILFVSVQELQDRYWRYFNMNELYTFFYQGVILVEMTEFIRFLEKRYGMNKVLELATVPYDKDEWAKYVGDQLYEIEREFANRMENMEYNGAFMNHDFIQELDELLLLYNTTTQYTLFSGEESVE